MERAGVGEREGGRPIGWEAIRVGRLGRCRQGLFPHVRIRKTVSSPDRSQTRRGGGGRANTRVHRCERACAWPRRAHLSSIPFILVRGQAGINCAVNVLHGFAVVSALMGKFPLGAALDRRRDATGAVVVTSTLTDSFPRPHPAVFTGGQARASETRSGHKRGTCVTYSRGRCVVGCGGRAVGAGA